MHWWLDQFFPQLPSTSGTLFHLQRFFRFQRMESNQFKALSRFRGEKKEREGFELALIVFLIFICVWAVQLFVIMVLLSPVIIFYFSFLGCVRAVLHDPGSWWFVQRRFDFCSLVNFINSLPSSYVCVCPAQTLLYQVFSHRALLETKHHVEYAIKSKEE